MKLAILIVLLCFQLRASESIWSFDSSVQTSDCVVTCGEFSSGWFYDLLGGTTRGYWDLGRTGTIVCTVTNTDPVDSIEVSVTQYQDGGIFDSLCSISGLGTLQSSTNEITEVCVPFGWWEKQTTSWKLQDKTNQINFTITSPMNGAVVDQVSAKISDGGHVIQLWIESSTLGSEWISVLSPVSVTNHNPSAIYRLRITQ